MQKEYEYFYFLFFLSTEHSLFSVSGHGVCIELRIKASMHGGFLKPSNGIVLKIALEGLSSCADKLLSTSVGGR